MARGFEALVTALFNRLRRPVAGPEVPRWRNWAGNQTCSPHQIARPNTEADIQRLVTEAARNGHRVRVAASGHSFTAAVCTDDVLVSLENLTRVRSIDRLNRTVTVDGGMPLHKLNDHLANVGLAMSNLGDIAYQTIAGAISTGTHGTGAEFGGMATQVRGLRIVTADGEVIDTSPFDNPALFHAARVGLGVFGIITQVTLAVEPAFNLHAVESVRSIRKVLDGWSDSVAEHDHYEFFWIPGTRAAATKANRRTMEPVRPLAKQTYLFDKILGENIAFGALSQAGRFRPSLIPKLKTLTVSSAGDSDFIDRSDKVFCSPRWVKFVEMEYSVPLDELPVVIDRIDKAITAAGIEVLFPIEARAAAADDIPLSMASGRACGYIAVHMAKGRNFRPYFELVEAIMRDHQGRPHWGKMHFHTAETLAPLYPQWEEFQRVRRGVDPTGRFSNAYTDRVLGAL